MTNYEKLQNAIKNTRGNVKLSLKELLETGEAQTGSSFYNKGYAHKSIWTEDVTNILDSLGIPYTYENIAPRGGANGEMVYLKGAALKRIKDIKKEEQISREILRAENKNIFLNEAADVIDLIRKKEEKVRSVWDNHSAESSVFILTNRLGFDDLHKYNKQLVKEAIRYVLMGEPEIYDFWYWTPNNE